MSILCSLQLLSHYFLPRLRNRCLLFLLDSGRLILCGCKWRQHLFSIHLVYRQQQAVSVGIQAIKQAANELFQLSIYHFEVNCSTRHHYICVCIYIHICINGRRPVLYSHEQRDIIGFVSLLCFFFVSILFRRIACRDICRSPSSWWWNIANWRTTHPSHLLTLTLSSTAVSLHQDENLALG